jgi:hypothetical protein
MEEGRADDAILKTQDTPSKVWGPLLASKRRPVHLTTCPPLTRLCVVSSRFHLHTAGEAGASATFDGAAEPQAGIMMVVGLAACDGV